MSHKKLRQEERFQPVKKWCCVCNQQTDCMRIAETGLDDIFKCLQCNHAVV